MIIYACNTDHSGTTNQNGGTQNQGASSNRPDELNPLFLNISLQMEKHVTGAIEGMKDEMKRNNHHFTRVLEGIKDEMKSNNQYVTGVIEGIKEDIQHVKRVVEEMELLREQYEQLNTKYVKLLENICGDESSIGEREREFQQLLQEKEALQSKLEISNVHKEELKKEEFKTKELYNENKTLKKEIDELKMESTRLEKQLETLLATENRNGMPKDRDQQKKYEEIQNIKAKVNKIQRFIEELTLRNKQILELKGEIRYLEKHHGIPRNASYFKKGKK